jgi:calcium-independent phospholipase A2-gamma
MKKQLLVLFRSQSRSIATNHVKFNEVIKNQGFKVLAVDGGGMRGVVPLEMLKCLAEQSGGREPHEMFNVFGGTSTGGLIALALGALKYKISDIEAMYLQMGEELFYNSITKRLLSVLKHRTQANSDALEHWVPKPSLLAWDRMQEESLQSLLFIVTAKVTDGFCTPHVFTNYSSGKDLYNPLLQEVALATSSAPLYFRPVTIDMETHWDGGVRNNNPSDLVLRELEKYWDLYAPKEQQAHHPLITAFVSLGTGLTITPPARSTFAKLREKFIYPFSGALFDSHQIHLSVKDRVAVKNCYVRLDPPISPFSFTVANPERLARLKRDTRRYMESMKRDVDTIKLQLGVEETEKSTLIKVLETAQYEELDTLKKSSGTKSAIDTPEALADSLFSLKGSLKEIISFLASVKCYNLIVKLEEQGCNLVTKSEIRNLMLKDRYSFKQKICNMSSVPEYFASMEVPRMKLLNYIKTSQGGVKTCIITGGPGTGRTKLALQIAKGVDLDLSTDNAVFWTLPAVSEHELLHSFKDLYLAITNTTFTGSDIVSAIRDELKSRPWLLVFDDINFQELFRPDLNIRSLIPDETWGNGVLLLVGEPCGDNMGSIVFKNHAAINLSTLAVNEARDVFTHVAGPASKDIIDRVNHALAAVKYSPLPIVQLAALFNDLYKKRESSCISRAEDILCELNDKLSKSEKPKLVLAKMLLTHFDKIDVRYRVLLWFCSLINTHNIPIKLMQDFVKLCPLFATHPNSDLLIESFILEMGKFSVLVCRQRGLYRAVDTYWIADNIESECLSEIKACSDKLFDMFSKEKSVISKLNILFWRKFWRYNQYAKEQMLKLLLDSVAQTLVQAHRPSPELVAAANKFYHDYKSLFSPKIRTLLCDYLTGVQLR